MQAQILAKICAQCNENLKGSKLQFNQKMYKAEAENTQV